MTQRLPIPCDSCANRITETSCSAFGLIPEKIRVWGDAHNVPEPDQGNDVVWEFAPGTELEFGDWKRYQETSG